MLYILSSHTAPQQAQNTKQTQVTNSVTLATVAQHSNENDCWMAINGKVYDVTSYIPAHPGNEIMKGCGKEATAMFTNERKHNGKAIAMLDQYEIATLGND